jgi:hypothetical protein
MVIRPVFVTFECRDAVSYSSEANNIFVHVAVVNDVFRTLVAITDARPVPGVPEPR